MKPLSDAGGLMRWAGKCCQEPWRQLNRWRHYTRAVELEERIGHRLELLARGFLKQVGTRPSVVFLPDCGSAMAFAQIITDIGEKEGTGIRARYVAGTGGKFGMTKAERKVNLDDYNQLA